MYCWNLVKAINEGAMSVVDDVPAYQFASDDISVCFSEASQMMASDVLNYKMLSVGIDNLMVEAAATGDEARLVALSENALTTIKDGIVKFFEKLIAAIKGIIEKLKAHIYQLTGKTSKWLNLMKPKVVAASRLSGASDFKAECYEWDENYITKTIPDAISALKTACMGTSAVDDIVNGYKTTVEDMQSIEKDDITAIDTAVKAVDDLTEESKTKTETKLKAAIDIANKNLKTDITEYDKSALSGDISKNTRVNGNTEKAEHTVGSKAMDMISVIEKSSDTLKAIEKTYTDQVKDLNNVRNKVKGIGDSGKFNNDVPGKYVAAVNAFLKAEYDAIVNVYSRYIDIMGIARDVGTNAMKSMVSDYMTVLTKFASYKAPKK